MSETPESGPTPTARRELAGSARRPRRAAREATPLGTEERITFSVRVRPAGRVGDAAPSAFADTPPGRRRYLSTTACAVTHGATDADLAVVREAAVGHGLRVVATHPAHRSLVLEGTAAAVEAMLGVTLEWTHEGEVSYRSRRGPIHLPAELADLVTGVHGLDLRPQARPRIRFHPDDQPGNGPGAQPGTATSTSPTTTATPGFTPPELAALYGFPDGDGAGQTIGLVELGGGYDPADLSAYLAALGLPVPDVVVVGVDGAGNAAGQDFASDAEVTLDLEVAAAIAPRARFVIYFAANTSRGYLDALSAAVHDPVNRPDVISLSWGSAEAEWTEQAARELDRELKAAAAMGITVCCAAGDHGATDGETDHQLHVELPASSPHLLACGGTRLTTSDGTLTAEVTWNQLPLAATGGGESVYFARPDYQGGVHPECTAAASADAAPPAASATKPTGADDGTGETPRAGRLLPDVAAVADQRTGYRVRVSGQDLVLGGTSAAAPLWAGLVARLNQRLGARCGLLNPLLYGSLAGSPALRDVTSGDNGAWVATPGWDACTGWGSPDGERLLAALDEDDAASR